MNLATIKDTAIRGANVAAMIVRKHAPEILIGSGLALGVGSTVLACKATLKLDETISECEQDEDPNKLEKACKIAKLYVPAATTGAAGIICVLAGYGVLHKRHVAVIGLYKACEKSFNDYRERVKEEYGEAKDVQFYNGMTAETVKEKIEVDGKKKTVTNTVMLSDGTVVSPYTRIFCEGNPNWSRNPADNKRFLEITQAQLTNKLRRKGHLFYNEVLETLGFPACQEGCVTGWVADGSLGEEDDFVDFGIYDIFNNDGSIDHVKVDFINGQEGAILLNFNVQGVIWDLI